MRRTLVLVAVLLTIACTSSGDRRESEAPQSVESEPTATDADRDDAATRAMSELEQRMLAAERVEIAFVIESEGAVESKLEGQLAWSSDGTLSLTATGTFAGQPQQLELRADATTIEVVHASEVRSHGPRPSALIEALVIGITRMGLLHNLAMLSAGLPPDHADGGATEWVEYIEPTLGPAEARGDAQARPLAIQITVSEQPVASATMWLDEDGLPIERQQVVNFPEGQLRVAERYTSFVAH